MKKIVWMDYLLGLLFVLMCILIFGVSTRSCKSGSKNSDYKEICIRGHVYYRSNFLSKMGLSIALDDDGKPILCEVKDD